MTNNNVKLEINLFEELNDEELIAVVGGDALAAAQAEASLEVEAKPGQPLAVALNSNIEL